MRVRFRMRVSMCVRANMSEYLCEYGCVCVWECVREGKMFNLNNYSTISI